MLTRIIHAARVAASGARALAPLASLARPLQLPAAAAARRAFSAGGEAHVLKVPGMGDSITEGALVKWLKKKGDYVALDEIILVIETDKVAVDVRAPLAGTLEETLAAVGDTVAVGAPLAKINPKGSAPAPGAGAAAAAAAPPKAAAPTPAAAAAPTPTPAAAAAAAAPPAPKAAAAPAAAAAATPAAAAAAGSREESRVKMTRMRLRIAQRCALGGRAHIMRP